MTALLLRSARLALGPVALVFLAYFGSILPASAGSAIEYGANSWHHSPGDPGYKGPALAPAERRPVARPAPVQRRVVTRPAVRKAPVVKQAPPQAPSSAHAVALAEPTPLVIQPAPTPVPPTPAPVATVSPPINPGAPEALTAFDWWMSKGDVHHNRQALVDRCNEPPQELPHNISSNSDYHNAYRPVGRPWPFGGGKHDNQKACADHYAGKTAPEGYPFIARYAYGKDIVAYPNFLPDGSYDQLNRPGHQDSTIAPITSAQLDEIERRATSLASSAPLSRVGTPTALVAVTATVSTPLALASAAPSPQPAPLGHMPPAKNPPLQQIRQAVLSVGPYGPAVPVASAIEVGANTWRCSPGDPCYSAHRPATIKLARG